VKVLLDENFPLALLRCLHKAGIEADHIITLNQRGIPDARIRERLRDEHLLFVTQDTDFLVSEPLCAAVVLVSSVRQSRPIADRVAVWLKAVLEILANPPQSRLLEVIDAGSVVPWHDAARRRRD
jgi:Domain of unknown function (DUF5615)